MSTRDPLRRGRAQPVRTDAPGTFSTITTAIVRETLIERVQPAPREAAPLLLLPLRLEYRVVAVDMALHVVAVDEPPVARGRRAEARRREERSAMLHSPLRVRAAETQAGPQIWFRWYPDEGFAERGVAPLDAADTAALAQFDATIGGRVWYDVTDAIVAGAWQTMAAALGPVRAVHVLRNRSAVGGGSIDRMGRIACLPRRVAIYALSNAGQAELVAVGSDISAPTAHAAMPVSYTAAALEPGGWLNSYQRAVELGMGVRVTDPAKVTAALDADWIVAVGLHAADGTAELQALVQDGVANGNFAFLPQDTATNAAPGAISIHTDPGADAHAFLRAATEHETGRVAAETASAAALFAEAIGVDPAVVRAAVNAADPAFEDARAMLRVVGPALLDAGVDGVTALDGIDEAAFLDVLAACVSARGPLPAVRFGRNPYGVLPVMRLARYAPEGDANSATFKVHAFMQQYALAARAPLVRRADAVVPVLEPDDAAASDKLDDILRVNAVSRRIDVIDTGAEDSAALGCPYVASVNHAPAAYLEDLRTKPIDQLADPPATQRGWPLLYRLARLSLFTNTVLRLQPVAAAGRMTLRGFELMTPQARTRALPRSLRGLSLSSLATSARVPANVNAVTYQQVRGMAGTFEAALARLRDIAARPDGIAQLETLLLESVDVFQHRVDAWASGLAYARLVERRRAGRTGLNVGYWGVLSKLRPTTATGPGDGYLQAPSLAQATTAAVLRSAYRRHRNDGAFAIDLPSRRVRRALAMLDLQRKGLSLAETLGLRGERWLHDDKRDVLIARLRTLFPLKNVTPPEAGAGNAPPQPVHVRIFDGLALAQASSLAAVPSAERDDAKRLQAVLRDDLDALADLVMCEAVHQRALGQTENASAWLNVLSGGDVPGDPVFVRVQRHGQGSSHRVSLLMQPAAPPAAPAPREVAEPTLTAYAEMTLAQFRNAVIPVTVNSPGGNAVVQIAPVTDLGMRPIDLVIGGESELRVRIRQRVHALWLTDAALVQALGAQPTTAIDAFFGRDVLITPDLAGGPVPVNALIAAAERLRALVQRGRPLEPSDLNAAATPQAPLTEAAEIALLNTAIQQLRARTIDLGNRLEQERLAYAAAQLLFLTRAREVRRELDTGGSNTAIAQALAQAELARTDLVVALLAVSRYAEPEALRPFVTGDVVADADAADATFAALNDRLGARRSALSSAASATAAAAQTRVDARAMIRVLTTALQSALDGEALPILPPIPRVTETTPLLDAAAQPQAALGGWAVVREGVARVLQALQGTAGMAAYPVKPEATDDDDPADPDPRGEEEAPRSRHFGVFVADAAAAAAGSFAGVVSDEWVEQRPSRSQLAALAINYDAPQSEPPHCLLLAMPPSPQQHAWKEPDVVDIVWETLQWLKARALSTDDTPTPAGLLATANQVPFQKAGNSYRRRIPAQDYAPGILQLEDGRFVAARGNIARGAQAAGLREITSRYTVQE